MAEEPRQMSREDIENVAKLETRQYFDWYLTEVWPRQQIEMMRQMQSMIDKHDMSPHAHDDLDDRVQTIKMRVDRAVWVMLGVAVAGGGSGAVVQLLIQSLSV